MKFISICETKDQLKRLIKIYKILFKCHSITTEIYLSIVNSNITLENTNSYSD